MMAQIMHAIEKRLGLRKDYELESEPLRHKLRAEAAAFRRLSKIAARTNLLDEMIGITKNGEENN